MRLLLDACLTPCRVQSPHDCAYSHREFVAHAPPDDAYTFHSVRKAKERYVSRKVTDAEADFVIIEDAEGAYEICHVEEVAQSPIELLSGSERRAASRRPSSIPLQQRMVIYRHSRFIYRPALCRFVLLEPEDFAPPADVDAGLSNDGAFAARHHGEPAVGARNLHGEVWYCTRSRFACALVTSFNACVHDTAQRTGPLQKRMRDW